MPLGFSAQGKLRATGSTVHFSSPCILTTKPQMQTKSAEDPTRSFLESEAMLRTSFSTSLPGPRTERTKPQSSVVPPRPRTPGEILPELLQQEIARKQIAELGTNALQFAGSPKISDADNYILQGEQTSLNAMLLPDTLPTAAPETTIANEPSIHSGKRNLYKTNTKLQNTFY